MWGSECALGLDMFDQQRTFGSQVPLLEQTSPTVLFAMLALSARQIECSLGAAPASKASRELYLRAMASLTPALERKHETVPVVACILCVLEMMSVSQETGGGILRAAQLCSKHLMSTTFLAAYYRRCSGAMRVWTCVMHLSLVTLRALSYRLIGES